MTVGSCFADTIGTRLSDHKFTALVNPFGTTYNPISIHKQLQLAIHNQPPVDHSYSNRDDVFFNFDFHSNFSSLSKKETENRIVDSLGVAHYFLKSARYLVITYGTSWVYEHADTKNIVANCHKIPQAQFKKLLLSRKAILESFEEFYKDLRNFNSEIKIILTVSPVRHLKDTLEGNAVSKSTLRLVCHSIASTYSDVLYFPAYEIQLDDLRDYRFYEPDLIHPSSQATRYIWEKFTHQFMDKKTLDFIEEWSAIKKAIEHKSFLPHSKSYKTFLLETQKRINELSVHTNVDAELAELKKLIG